MAVLKQAQDIVEALSQLLPLRRLAADGVH